MVLKLINASEARSGTAILLDNIAYIVKSNDISKTGKHGHAKCRIEAVSIIDGKKKVFVSGGHERLDVPNIIKARAQVMSVAGEKATIMDLESYETLEIPIHDDVKGEIKEEMNIEYWDIEGNKIVKRKV